MSDMEISCNVISKSCLFPTDPTENFSEIKPKFANSIFAQNDREMVIIKNNLINFISAENHNIKSVSIPKQKYRTLNKRDSH